MKVKRSTIPAKSGILPTSGSELKPATKSSAIYVLIWIAGSGIAVVMALLLDTASYVDGQYIPVGNDSFYHARRILDAAIGNRGFYQFDEMIHVPDGSWLTWPWAYDYLMARALAVALWFQPNIDPMAFLAHVPVAWVLVNAGLFTLIGRQIGISASLTAIGMLGFSLLPLTQTLHGLGIIDHHYIELTFVLAAVLTGIRFFSGRDYRGSAIFFGTVLGIAPAFHNGLFVLQVPLLAAWLILWVRGNLPTWCNSQALALALVVSTLLVALPSEPFRELQFEFWTLSWFHLYVALCSAIILTFLRWRPVSRTSASVLIFGAAAMAAPVFTKLLIGTSFLTGDLILLSEISEVESPVARLVQPSGVRRVVATYSWLIFLTPILLASFAMQFWSKKTQSRVYISAFAIFGLLLMLTQSRLHPFGSWALLLGSLLILDEWRKRLDLTLLQVSAASLLILAVAFQPPLEDRLFRTYPPGLSRNYAASRTLYPSLATLCAEDPGVVLSNNDDGHYIRYHTDCSVLTNNFLITPLHEKKLLEAITLLRMTPKQLVQATPQIKYVFVRMSEIFEIGPNGVQAIPLEDVKSRNAPLFKALTFGNVIPEEFRLVKEVRVADDRDFAYARVFKIVRDD